MVARGRGGRLGEVDATEGVRSAASQVGGGTLFRLDLPQQEDEQGLREAMCERRSVRVRCDDSPHDEAARSSLRTFHTVSLRASEMQERAAHQSGPIEEA